MSKEKRGPEYFMFVLSLIAGLILGYSIGIRSISDGDKRRAYLDGYIYGLQCETLYLEKKFKLAINVTPLPTPTYLRPDDITEIGK